MNLNYKIYIIFFKYLLNVIYQFMIKSLGRGSITMNIKNINLNNFKTRLN
jgi:hypothetical protein